MRILITAGGTSEKIDEVRAITNHSTGSLGKELAAAFGRYGDVTIDYIVATTAIKPEPQAQLTLFPITDTKALETTMRELLQKNNYDAVIHSMAVSDFTPTVSVSDEVFLAALNQQLKTSGELTKESFAAALQALSQEATAKKISSDTEHLVMVMKQNPKIIHMIKELQPATKLVGFKLLVGVTQEELLRVAGNTLKKNQASYVFANDLETIHDGRHQGYLIDADGIVGTGETKAEIATLIAETLRKKDE